MTIVRKIIVECNKCGKEIEVPTHGLGPVNLRRFIETRGWVHGGGKHYCPQCVNDNGNELGVKVNG